MFSDTVAFFCFFSYLFNFLFQNGEKCSFIASTTDENRTPHVDRSAIPQRYNALDVAAWLLWALIGILTMASVRVAAYYPAYKASRWIVSHIGSSFINRNGDVWNVMLSYSAGLQPFYVNPFLPLLAEQVVVDDMETIIRSNINVVCFVPITFILLILSVQGSLIVAKWLVVWRIRPGRVYRGSFTRFRFWFYCLLVRNAASQLLVFDDTWYVVVCCIAFQSQPFPYVYHTFAG